MKQPQLFLHILFLFLLTATGLAQEPAWELKKEKDGIKVFTRDIANFGLDEFKGEAVVNGSVMQILAILKDAENWPQWVPDCASSKLLAVKDSNTQMHYSITNLPFPLADRDVILHLNFIPTTSGYHVELNGLPQHLPDVDGLIRIPHIKGYWIIASISETESHVTYQAHTDPGGTVPLWLANSTAISTPFNTLKNLREYLQ